jgi:hypothetical protein
MNKILNVQGKRFELIPLTGMEAVRRSYFLLKLVGGVFARVASGDNFKQVLTEATEGESSFDFSKAIDHFFSVLTEKEFESMFDLLLGQITFEGSIFKQIWESKFQGDPAIALELMFESFEPQFGFFSAILPKVFAKFQGMKAKQVG